MRITVLLLLLTEIGFGQSLNMQLVGSWTDTDTNANRFNDCWGWSQDGKEYAVFGSNYATYIMDVTNPASPVEIDRVLGRGNSAVHRDYKKYQNYLYGVTDQNQGSLQIMDLSYLPDSVHLVYDEDTLINLSHNIFIDTARAVLYSCGGKDSTGNKQLQAIDISNPTNPILITDFELDVAWWTSTIGYVHDMYIRDDTAFLNHEDGLAIMDFSNLLNPVLLGNIDSYPAQGYNHSGWLHDNDSLYILLDETDGKKVKFFDVSDPTNIQFIDTIGTIAGYDTNAMPHNGFFLDDLAFVSYYHDGAYVYDVSDPNNIFMAGFYDDTNHIGSLWGIYPYLPSRNIIISDIQNGLMILQLNYYASIENNLYENKELSLHPNPASQGDVIYLEETSTFEIYSSTGEFIEKYQKVKSFSTIDLKSGVYFMVSQNGRSSFVVY